MNNPLRYTDPSGFVMNELNEDERKRKIESDKVITRDFELKIKGSDKVVSYVLIKGTETSVQKTVDLISSKTITVSRADQKAEGKKQTPSGFDGSISKSEQPTREAASSTNVSTGNDNGTSNTGTTTTAPNSTTIADVAGTATNFAADVLLNADGFKEAASLWEDSKNFLPADKYFARGVVVVGGVVLAGDVALNAVTGGAKAGVKAGIKAGQKAVHAIYVLVDKTGAIRYVGRTSREVATRFAEHAARDFAKAKLFAQELQGAGRMMH